MIEDIKRQLRQVFEMKYLGKFHYFLGLKVWRGNGKTIVTQSKHVKELLKKINIDECKTMSTPLEQNVKLNNDDGIKLVDGTLYR